MLHLRWLVGLVVSRRCWLWWRMLWVCRVGRTSLISEVSVESIYSSSKVIYVTYLSNTIRLRRIIQYWRLLISIHMLRWSRCFPPWRGDWTARPHHILLITGLLLLALQIRSSPSDQVILNGSCDICRKHRPGIHGTGYRFLPRLKHLVKLLANLGTSNGRVCFHKGFVQVATKEQCVRGTNIFHHRVKNV